jgi:hypothetical protein
MDLETAQRLERLEAQVALLYRHLGLSGSEAFLSPPATGEPQDAVPGGGIPRDPRLPNAFYEALVADKKIQAIKLYREATGVGLREAKQYVDSLDPIYRRRR